jgi:hypothetical protein
MSACTVSSLWSPGPGRRVARITSASSSRTSSEYRGWSQHKVLHHVSHKDHECPGKREFGPTLTKRSRSAPQHREWRERATRCWNGLDQGWNRGLRRGKARSGDSWRSIYNNEPPNIYKKGVRDTRSLNITYASPSVTIDRVMGSCDSNSTGSSRWKLFRVFKGP